MSIYSDKLLTARERLYGRETPMHAFLGGGRVADILLWRNKKLSAAILMGFTFAWFLLKVVEYNFVTLLCHISIVLMLINFILSTGAGFFNRTPPDIRYILLPESTFKWVFTKINQLLRRFYYISSGKDTKHFVLTIAFLGILSAIGSYVSPPNLLYIGYLCLAIIPAFYERYKAEVDYRARRGYQLYKEFVSYILNKIPRGPVKEKRLG